MNKFKKGFTLIELLVVIAIIGILSAVVLTSLNGARMKSRDAKRLSDVSQLQLALELFYDSCKQFPTSLATSISNNCPLGVNLGTFIDPIPKDPITTAVYKYVTNSGSPTNYHLGAALETPVNTDRDKDFVSNASPNVWTNGFNGGTDNTCGQSSLSYTPAKCYDVTGQ